jgi:hypothetical protein
VSSTTASRISDKQALRHELPGELAQFNGDLDRYRHWRRKLIFTPGIKHLADRAGAFWLVDLVASWQLNGKVAAEQFQVWTLAVRSDQTATATATDGNRAEIARQEIPFTDFPLAEITVWFDGGTLMLPSEY